MNLERLHQSLERLVDSAVATQLEKAFNPSQHPRYPKGHPRGGQFMDARDMNDSQLDTAISAVERELRFRDDEGSEREGMDKLAALRSEKRRRTPSDPTAAAAQRRSQDERARRLRDHPASNPKRRADLDAAAQRLLDTVNTPRRDRSKPSHVRALEAQFPPAKAKTRKLKRGDEVEVGGKKYRYAGTNMGQGTFFQEVGKPGRIYPANEIGLHSRNLGEIDEPSGKRTHDDFLRGQREIHRRERERAIRRRRLGI